MKRAFSIGCILLALLCLLLFITGISWGPAHISLREIAGIIFSDIKTDPVHYSIIRTYRFPETVTAMISGGLLAVGGLMLQTLFRNPLAGPSVLGVSSGASFGVILFSSGLVATGFLTAGEEMHTMRYAVPVMAIAGSLLVMFFMLFIYRLSGNLFTVLLAGVMISFFLSALESILLNLSTASVVKQFVSWGFGSFSATGPDRILMFAFIGLLLMLFALLSSARLDAIQFGNDQSMLAGKNPAVTQWVIIVLTAAMTAWVTAFCGPIAFIGLCVPHIVRPLVRSVSHFRLILLCILAGAAVAMICLLIMRLEIFNNSLPLNAITSFMGAPFVIYVLIRYKNVNAFR